jgi:hypothetical protein
VTKWILISVFLLYGLILLYLQFRWLLRKRNTEGFTTRVMDATRMLPVGYDAMN